MFTNWSSLFIIIIIIIIYFKWCGPGSSVSIATDYGLDGQGIESQWERDFPPVQTGPGAHTASCKMDTGPFPRVKCGRSVILTIHPLLVPRSWKSRDTITLPTLWTTTGPVMGSLYLILFLDKCRSHCPHGLRRRSAAAPLLRVGGSNPTGPMDVCLL